MIIERSASDALRRSIEALEDDAARALADTWFARSYSEVSAEVFRLAGLQQEADELARLDVLHLGADELLGTLNDFRRRVMASGLWAERSHAACESLRCAAKSVVGYSIRDYLATLSPRDRARKAAFTLVLQALFVDRALASSEALERAPFAQATLDRIRAEIAARQT